MLNTAVDDEIILRSLCCIKGAGQEIVPERLVITLAELFVITARIQPRYRALVLPFRKSNELEVAAGADPEKLIDDSILLLKVEHAVSQLNSGEQRRGQGREAQ